MVVVADAPKVTNGSIKISVLTVAALWVGANLFRAAVWVLRHPPLWFAGIAAYGVWRWWDASGIWPLVAALGVLLLCALVGWRLGHAASFRRLLAWPIKAWWRRMFVYGPGWQAVHANLHLSSKRRNQDEEFPGLVRVRSTSTVDKVRLRMLPGQVLADFAKNADRFATTFEALDCRVRSIPRRQPLRHIVYRTRLKMGHEVPAPEPRPSKFLELWFLLSDPLAVPTQLLEVADRTNLKAARRGAAGGRAGVGAPAARHPPAGHRCNRRRQGLGVVVDRPRTRARPSVPGWSSCG